MTEPQEPRTAAGRDPAGDKPPFMARHDPGCHCWPHVSESDALEAITQAAVADARAQVEALRAALAGLDAAWRWVIVTYPKALTEMPSHLFAAFEAARRALAAEYARLSDEAGT